MMGKSVSKERLLEVPWQNNTYKIEHLQTKAFTGLKRPRRKGLCFNGLRPPGGSLLPKVQQRHVDFGLPDHTHLRDPLRTIKKNHL